MNLFVKPFVEELHIAALKYQKNGSVMPILFNGYQAFLKTGHRQLFEDQYFARRRQLAVLILDSYLSPSPEGLELLENVIWEVCNEYTWAVPAHVPTKNDQFTTDSHFFIDLFAAETAHTLAEGKHLLSEKLSPMIQHRIDEELEQRIFEPFIKETWFWETMENNWSAVVPGAIGMAALWQFNNEERLIPLLSKVDHCLKSYLASFDSDGTCKEGIGYWSYGFGYFIYFAELYRKIRKDSRYFQLSKVKAIASFPYKIRMNGKGYIPFSDYTGTDIPTGLLSFCEEEYKLPVTKKEMNSLDFDHAYRFAHLSRNLLWGKEGKEYREDNSQNFYLPKAQWLIKKNREKNFFFAAKAGINNESHNHNDVGHFVLGGKRGLFLTDLGAGEYTTSYFLPETRYDFLTTSSEGHSVPIINSEFERAGNYMARDVVNDEKGFLMEMTDVYPERTQLKSFIRSFHSSDNLCQIELSDQFSFSMGPNTVIENFITLIKPVIFGKQVILKEKGGECRIQFETDKIKLIEKKYADHSGKQKKAYLIQAEYVIENENSINILFRINEM
ncbi:hypothetical protein [Enterococcus sp. JM9B]|uniref:hypothetical protein n=1 Tax=Enterococcus sp. JM9B TaxID=1857216 RepID=UPI001374C0AF|nr:hypothetical protein [Enterococcus sp. JM9B]KAF1303127.1 hypothetical protein BAU16_05475 [Enterococcus sp. JM9B]